MDSRLLNFSTSQPLGLLDPLPLSLTQVLTGPKTKCARWPLVRGSWVLKIFGNLEKALITPTSASAVSCLAMRKT